MDYYAVFEHGNGVFAGVLTQVGVSTPNPEPSPLVVERAAFVMEAHPTVDMKIFKDQLIKFRLLNMSQFVPEELVLQWIAEGCWLRTSDITPRFAWVAQQPEGISP